MKQASEECGSARHHDGHLQIPNKRSEGDTAGTTVHQNDHNLYHFVLRENTGEMKTFALDETFKA